MPTKANELNTKITASTFSVTAETGDDVCTFKQASAFSSIYISPTENAESPQPRKSTLQKKAGTFSLNKQKAFHRWYSYLEGYSSSLIEQQLDLFAGQIESVYDPFAGTGTTLLVAAQRGISSFYSEVNPFMCEVIDSKINAVRSLVNRGLSAEPLELFLKMILSKPHQFSFNKLLWGGFEKYFDENILSELFYIKECISDVKDDDVRKILLIVLASIIVNSSKMIRRGDLRFAKAGEKKPEDFALMHNFTKKLKEVILDISSFGDGILCDTTKLSFDSRDIDLESKIDCVITSPPYLNGTNYIRNTKLELKLLEFIDTENDLPFFHSKGIIAGINNVSKRNNEYHILPCVEPYVKQLEPVAYDKRIISMVTGYFWDMNNVIERLKHALKDGGIFVLDIGDSQFAGVHIPTHELLSDICTSHGFEKFDEEILRERRSKNGMVLSQRLLKFRLKKCESISEIFRIQAQNFIRELPYRTEPYAGRNWGHSWHSLCSYHGKLKPAIAHFLVSAFTEKGDVVLDPLCGVGTIPFEACLQGRIGYGNDLSEMAYAVTKAKVEPPSFSKTLTALASLEAYIEENKLSPETESDVKRFAEFGFNGGIAEYFHPTTFLEILCARRFFLDKQKTMSSEESMVFSCLLHVLHGNRPYALSRKSHPLTPYAPSGDFIYKSIVTHITNKFKLSFAKSLPDSFTSGKSIFGDYSQISQNANQAITVDAIICSPPFANSIRFYMNNWMRLWLSGWEIEDFKIADEKFLDVKQRNNFAVYNSFFAMCHETLKTNGKLILHLGKTDKVDMAEELSSQATPYFTEVFRGSEDVHLLEKHGIRDKGGTIEHQFLFLIKK